MEYIRNFYNVPAKRLGLVKYKGKQGKITGYRNAYLLVTLDGESRCKPYHPMDLEYLP